MLPSLATLPTKGLFQSKQALLLDDGADNGDVPMGQPVPVLVKTQEAQVVLHKELEDLKQVIDMIPPGIPTADVEEMLRAELADVLAIEKGLQERVDALREKAQSQEEALEKGEAELKAYTEENRKLTEELRRVDDANIFLRKRVAAMSGEIQEAKEVLSKQAESFETLLQEPGKAPAADEQGPIDPVDAKQAERNYYLSALAYLDLYFPKRTLSYTELAIAASHALAKRSKARQHWEDVMRTPFPELVKDENLRAYETLYKYANVLLDMSESFQFDFSGLEKLRDNFNTGLFESNGAIPVLTALAESDLPRNRQAAWLLWAMSRHDPSKYGKYATLDPREIYS